MMAVWFGSGWVRVSAIRDEFLEIFGEFGEHGLDAAEGGLSGEKPAADSRSIVSGH